MKLKFAALTSSLVISLAQIASAAPFDLDAIKALAERPDVRTVEDFIAKTPSFMRADGNFAVAYNPHGLVSGSPQTPSLLLFGDQNSYVELVVSSRPTTPETVEDAVEILAFDPVAQRHELARLSFRKDQAPRLEVHPHKCLVCHGENPKPLWRSAFKWEGFFGAAAGAFTKTTVTPATTTEMDEQRVWSEIVDQPGARFALLDLKQKVRTSANLKLTAKLTIEHTFVIAQKILKQKRQSADVVPLIAALALCEGDAFYERDRVLKSLGINSSEWYMNSQLKADASQGLAANAVLNESFQFGEGPMDYLLISHLLKAYPEIDRSLFVRHRDSSQDWIEAKFKTAISPLMPDVYFTPIRLGAGSPNRTPQAWCAKFRAAP